MLHVREGRSGFIARRVLLLVCYVPRRFGPSYSRGACLLVDVRSRDRIADKIIKAMQAPNQMAAPGWIPGWREMAARIAELYGEVNA